MKSFRINVCDDQGKDIINDSITITPIGSVLEGEAIKGNPKSVDIVHVCSSFRGSLVFLEDNEHFIGVWVEGTGRHDEDVRRGRLEILERPG